MFCVPEGIILDVAISEFAYFSSSGKEFSC